MTTPRTGRLKKDAISALGAAAVAMAFMGPATSVYFNTSPAASGAGRALPLAMLLALVVCALVASAIGEFARKLPSAGFAYTFTTHGFGRQAGFLAGWILVLAYAMVGPMLFAVIGALTSDFLAAVWGVRIPYWVFTVAFVAVIWGIAALGLERSAQTALLFLVIEVGVLAALFATVLLRGGAGEPAALPASGGLLEGVGVSGLGIGMLWGILCFIGFESAGTLGEETADARRSIPLALFASVGIIGIFYVLAAYAAVAGFGASGVGRLAGDSEPWATLTRQHWGGGMLWLVSLTVLSSVFANLISGCNAAVRILFALGRENILPAALGRIPPSRKPVAALSAYMLFSLAVALAGSATLGPLAVWSFCGTLLGLGVVVVYIMVNLALFRYYRREHPAEFSAVRHGVLPAAASLLMLLPVYGLVWPVPAFPNNLVPYILLAWTALGGLHLAAISKRRPEVLDAMGRVWGNEPEDDLPAWAPAPRVPAGAAGA